MCGEPLMPEKGQHECKAIFWWYNICQNLSTKTNVEYYPVGKEPNAQNIIWDSYSLYWVTELQGAVGANGDLSRESVKRIFNGDIRTLTPEMMIKIESKIRLISAAWKLKNPATTGKERPTLGIDSLSVSRCTCCFDNPVQYNDHMKSIH